MTIPSEETLVPEPADSDPSRRGGVDGGATDQPAADSSDGAQPAGSDDSTDGDSGQIDSEESQPDGLPEAVPLTPELLEDEAIRGDFMLRMFVLVLAALLACTQIAETTTLVHVKTGQYLAGHGWWPGGTDVFSYTANGRRWVNLSWLFDLISGGVFAAGGAKLLTIFKTFLVAITFFLILCCARPGVSTWWGSIAAALALLACHPQFTALPELVTLLGLAVVLWVLHHWQKSEGNRNALWWLVPAFIVWSNLDDRMFLGLALLLLFAVGEFVGSLLGYSGFVESQRRKQLWMVVGLCVLAACLNPFGWNSLTAPRRLYGIEYPALRGYYEGSSAAVHLAFFPLFNGQVVQRPHVVAGLVLLASTLVTFVLNRRQVDYGYLFAVLGFFGFAAVASHEIAAAAVVACVVATLNGQDWYRDRFTQTYSVDLKERFFSSGGRVVTVLSLFFIAILAASGRLNDPASRRIGLGFTPELNATITGLRADTEDRYDNHSFHFVLRQGDLLIWLGRNVFIDNRVAIYSGIGREDLIALHSKTRQSLHRRIEGEPLSGRDEIWKSVFDRFQITHVLPRLSGLFPGYKTFLSLQEPKWTMTRLGSMTAVIYRTDTRSQDAPLDEYLKTRTVNAVKDAFQKEMFETDRRPSWPQARSALQKLLSSNIYNRPWAVQTAGHYDRYLHEHQSPNGQVRLSRPARAAMAHLAIRYANQGLAEEPDCADAFHVLGNAYSFLGRLESSISNAGGGFYNPSRRYRQSIAAYNQAALLEPKRAPLHFLLFRAYRANGRNELAVRALRKYESLAEFESDLSEEVQAQKTRRLGEQEQLQSQVEAQMKQVDAQLVSPNADLFQVAQFAYNNGCVLRSLKILEQDPNLVDERPDAKLFFGTLLHEAGRVQEADEILTSLDAVAEQYQLRDWQTPAAWASLANGNYDRAIFLWTLSNNSRAVRQLTPLLTPLVVVGPSLFWTPFHSLVVNRVLVDVNPQLAPAVFEIALTHLEAGQNRRAADAFRLILKIDPATRYRPLVGFYLFQLTGKEIETLPPSQRFPMEPHEMFTPASEDPAAPKP